MADTKIPDLEADVDTVPEDPPFTPSQNEDPNLNMESRRDSTFMISEPKNFCGSTGGGANYGTLQLSSSSDLQLELRRRGYENEKSTPLQKIKQRFLTTLNTSLHHLHKLVTTKRKLPPRSITKNGKSNFVYKNLEQQKRKFIEDIFTSLLEVKWRWTLFVFCFMYFGSWSLFAGGWYLILYLHGDLANYGAADWKPCISGIHNFASAFLFSVETQHTTGYGFYHLSDECPDAIILMCVQSIVGVILEGLMVGLVFVKMTRAKKRIATIIFSKTAVINQRDGKLCFMFRVGDMTTKSNLLEAHIRAQLIRKRTTMEGEVISYHQEELIIRGNEEKSGKILLFWPTTIVHLIDSNSPMYDISPSDLTIHNTSFEIIVVLEGIVESTGLTAQARSSYLPSEIIWGHRFEDLQSVKSVSAGERVVDYALFHQTYPVTTTTSSSYEMDTAAGNSVKLLPQDD